MEEARCWQACCRLQTGDLYEKDSRLLQHVRQQPFPLTNLPPWRLKLFFFFAFWLTSENRHIWIARRPAERWFNLYLQYAYTTYWRQHPAPARNLASLPSSTGEQPLLDSRHPTSRIETLKGQIENFSVVWFRQVRLEMPIRWSRKECVAWIGVVLEGFMQENAGEDKCNKVCLGPFFFA